MSTEKILVVDDEPDICGLVSDILTDEGYQVSAADNAASARARVEESNYDLVLLDIWMPDEDGITLLKDWKSKKVLHCPVVMMSGHGTVETAVEAIKMGAYDFILKPFSPDQTDVLIEKANKWLQMSEKQIYLNKELDKEVGLLKEIIGKSQEIQEINKLVHRVAGYM